MLTLKQERIRLRKLLSQACDAELCSEDKRELEQLLSTNYEQLSVEYFDFLSVDALLRDPGTLRRLQQMIADDSGMNSKSAPTIHSSRSKPASSAKGLEQVWSFWQPAKRRRFAAWVAIAATIVFASWIWRTGSFGQHAVVVATEQARWKDNRDRDVGEVVAGKWLELESGSVQFLFDRGAQASLHGPARFRTCSDNSCELQYGELGIYAPESAQRFQVAGPGYVVTDLGTSFRLVSDPAAEVRLRISAGSVELEHEVSGTSRELVAGETVAFSAQAAPRSLPAASSDCETRGDMQFITSHPRSLGRGQFRENRRLAAFLERSNVRLLQDQPLDVASSGRHVEFESGNILSSGTVADVYLIHFAPQQRGFARGSIRFPRKIIGLLCESGRLNATNALLGDPSTLRCQHPERGLELSRNPNSDVVTLSQDRRELSIACRAESIDQLRVLVESQIEGLAK